MEPNSSWVTKRSPHNRQWMYTMTACTAICRQAKFGVYAADNSLAASQLEENPAEALM